MKACGIIAEYNPFHNGHMFHIKKTKEVTGADCIVAVMSASFVQRGEISVYSKHSRAEAAVRGGADIVFELPSYFALQSANGFAKGGVGLLKAAGVDFISFGAECKDLKKLTDLSLFLSDEPEEFKEKIIGKQKKGFTYARSRSDALKELGLTEYADILSGANNILAIEYISAIQGSNIVPVCIERKGSGHDSDIPKGKIASASYIRNSLAQGVGVSEYVPYTLNEKPLFFEDFEDLILYSLSDKTSKDLEKIQDCGGGLAERIISADKKTLSALTESIKAKNLTMARIKRVLMNILIGNTLPAGLSPSYLRVLAFNETGAKYLKSIKNTAALPLITKPSSYKENDALWKLELRASRIRSLKSEIKKEDVATSPIQISSWPNRCSFDNTDCQ